MIPPHRVTSSCRQSTAPAVSSRAESASVQLYSPAATSASTWPRTAASPATSCEETGSSNQVTANSSIRYATRTAWATEPYPPLASTYSSVSGPMTDRASATRVRSRSSRLPHDSPILIFTRGIRSLSTQLVSWSRVWLSS